MVYVFAAYEGHLPPVPLDHFPDGTPAQSIKLHIRQKFGIPMHLQRLEINGKHMHPHDPLGQTRNKVPIPDFPEDAVVVNVFRDD
ncbi:hypothetical protein JCM10207_002886 [Rhodosporidiobolus poonsookiae]